MEIKSVNHSRIRAGAICGLAGIVCYFLAAFAPLPDKAALFLAFAFGPLLAVSCGGIYYFLKGNQPTFRLIIAVISGISAGITLLIMLTAQQAIFAALMTNKPEESGKPMLDYISATSNAVHLGVDVAWDVLISIAVFLFSLEFFQRKGMLKIMGIAGIIFSLLLLTFNLWYFPQPPGNAGSVDFGPFVAIWLIWVYLILLISKKETAGN